ncbi:MAG: phytanoyl-CoA dioxygenase family protein [Parvularculaceae bacterium]
MASTGLTSAQAERYHRDGFLSGSAFTQADIDDVRAMIAPLIDQFSDQKRNRRRDVGAMGDLAVGSQQPEIDRPTLTVPALKKTAVYLKTLALAETLLGRSPRYTFDHVICKMPGTKARTAWHQDRGYLISDVKLDTVNFWIPLQDTNQENGTLGYVPKSHLDGLQEHGSDPALHPHIKTTPLGETDPIYCDFKVGDYGVHHPLTVHGAGPNLSDAPRYAWIIHFSPYGRLGYLKPANIIPILKRFARIH